MYISNRLTDEILYFSVILIFRDFSLQFSYSIIGKFVLLLKGILFVIYKFILLGQILKMINLVLFRYIPIDQYQLSVESGVQEK